MANVPRLRDHGLLLLLVGIPAAVFAVVFLGSLAYFRLTDEEVAGTNPAARSTTESGPPAAAGSGRLLVALSAESNEPAEAYLASVALDGSDLVSITGPPAEGGIASDGYPALSPDGETIAFKRATAAPTGSTDPHIYLVKADGSNLQRLTTGRGAELNPAWSPDGTEIAFARETQGQFDLFACASDGSGLRRITDTPNDDEDYVAWSPDGEQLAFARFEGGFERGSGDLWVVTADGREETLVLGGPGRHSGPAWSPDGERFLFVEEGHLAVMNADGTEVRPITEGELMDTRPTWSPDGSRILFTRDPGTILLINPDGTQLAEVPLDAPAGDAAWAGT
jgi:Tol biopolymer transport system component